MLKSVGEVATTCIRASMPVCCQYAARASCGCTCPNHLSLSVYVVNVSTSMRFLAAQSIGSAQSVPPYVRPATRRATSSSAMCGDRFSGLMPWLKPYTPQDGSVFMTTSDMAAVTSEHRRLYPAVAEFMEPETSSEIIVRLPAGSTVPKDR